MANNKLQKQLLDKMAKEVITFLKKERGNMKAVKEYLYNYVLDNECEIYQDDWWSFIQDVIEDGYNSKPLKKMTVHELAVEAIEFIVGEKLTNRNYDSFLQGVKDNLSNGGTDDGYDNDDDED